MLEGPYLVLSAWMEGRSSGPLYFDPVHLLSGQGHMHRTRASIKKNLLNLLIEGDHPGGSYSNSTVQVICSLLAIGRLLHSSSLLAFLTSRCLPGACVLFPYPCESGCYLK